MKHMGDQSYRRSLWLGLCPAVFALWMNAASRKRNLVLVSTVIFSSRRHARALWEQMILRLNHQRPVISLNFTVLAMKVPRVQPKSKPRGSKRRADITGSGSESRYPHTRGKKRSLLVLL
jgi:hypothetical protein